MELSYPRPSPSSEREYVFFLFLYFLVTSHVGKVDSCRSVAKKTVMFCQPVEKKEGDRFEIVIRVLVDVFRAESKGQNNKVGSK